MGGTGKRVNLMFELNINPDSIEIEGQIIKRPSWIARTSWMQYWEAIKMVSHDGCNRGDCGVTIHPMVV